LLLLLLLLLLLRVDDEDDFEFENRLRVDLRLDDSLVPLFDGFPERLLLNI
jgi:hypothetical protein